MKFISKTLTVFCVVAMMVNLIPFYAAAAETDSPLMEYFNNGQKNSYTDMSGDGDETTTDVVSPNQPEEYVFSFGGKDYVLLSEEQDQNFVLGPSMGVRRFGEHTIVPDVNSNLVGYLNTDGKSEIDENVLNFIKEDSVWQVEHSLVWNKSEKKYASNNDSYTFTAGISVMSLSEFLMYWERLGVDTISNMWLRTPGTTKQMAFMSDEFAYVSNLTAEKNVRPVYYLKDDFFKSVLFDEDTLGDKVVEKLAGLLSLDELLELGYSPKKLVEWGLMEPPVQPEALEVSISVKKAVPGYPVSVDYTYYAEDGVAEGNSIIEWHLSDSKDGEYTPFEGATGNTFAIKNKWAGKWLKAYVIPVNAKGVEADTGTYSQNAIKVGDPLPVMDNMKLPAKGTIDDTSADWSFTYKSVVYQMLDYEIDEGKTQFFILKAPHSGQGRFSTDGSIKMEPENPVNIAHWFKNEVDLKASPNQSLYVNNGLMNFASGINNDLRLHLDLDHQWLTEGGAADSSVGEDDYIYEGGVSLMSANEYYKYVERVNRAKFTSMAIIFRTPQKTPYVGSDGRARDALLSIAPGGASWSAIVPTSGGLYGLVFYIDKGFFLEYYVDPADMGAEVKKMLTATISLEEMQNAPAGYSAEDLRAIGYPDSVGYADKVSISGMLAMGETIRAEYEYNDNDTGVADSGKAAYQWYRGKTATGEFTMISGATDDSYTLGPADVGMFIKVSVTPYDEKGVMCTQGEGVGAMAVKEAQEMSAVLSGFDITSGVLSVDVEVSTQTDEEIMIVVVEYDSMGGMVQTSPLSPTSVTKAQKLYTKTMAVESTSNTFKLLVFDSLDSLRPLCIRDLK